jgi:callose synthase
VCVAFQLRRIKRSDATLSAELTPYNIVPLEAPSLTNAIRVFPEVSQVLNNIYFKLVVLVP